MSKYLIVKQVLKCADPFVKSLPDERHLVGAVLGCQQLLPLLLTLLARGEEYHLIGALLNL